jgi:hypothetical protein
MPKYNPINFALEDARRTIGQQNVQRFVQKNDRLTIEEYEEVRRLNVMLVPELETKLWIMRENLRERNQKNG